MAYHVAAPSIVLSISHAKNIGLSDDRDLIMKAMRTSCQECHFCSHVIKTVVNNGTLTFEKFASLLGSIRKIQGKVRHQR